MSALHDWHRKTFTHRTAMTLVFPAYTTNMGVRIDEVRSDVTLASARSVVAQRVVNSLTPDEWVHAQAAFDDSPEGLALATKDVGDRREHAILWILHSLHESDHPTLVPVTELALQRVLDHHASAKAIAIQKARLMAFVKDGEALHVPAVAPVAQAVTS